MSAWDGRPTPGSPVLSKHWAATKGGGPEIVVWLGDGWMSDSDAWQADEAIDALDYLGPCLTPADIAARERAARETALREAADIVELEAQHYTGLREGSILHRQALAILALIEQEPRDEPR